MTSDLLLLKEQLANKLNVEDRYDELHFYVRKVLRYNGVDNAKFDIALRQLDAVIQRHIQEDSE